jgi:hypothetical protein
MYYVMLFCDITRGEGLPGGPAPLWPPLLLLLPCGRGVGGVGPQRGLGHFFRMVYLSFPPPPCQATLTSTAKDCCHHIIRLVRMMSTSTADHDD